MPLPQKPVNSPFHARATAQDVVAGIDLSGRTAIVTGASAGLGVETARALGKAGADIVLPVRSKEKGEAAAADISKSTGANVETAAMDLGDCASVRRFAKDFVASGRALDLLINNAGIMATPERRVGNGYESQFGTNHLGHMLLTCTLAPALLKSGRARVVELSSIGHRRAPVNFDDPNFDKRPYDKWEAYGQSKTANSLFAVELNRRLEPKGVFAYAVHPGGIMTELQRDMSRDEIRAFGWVDDNGKVNDRFKSVAQGAATSCWAATSALLDAGGGVYCEDCNVAVALPADAKEMSGARPWAIDPEAAKKLWSLSETLLGEKFDV